MLEILDDEFMVCSDCLMVIANGDYSGLAIDPSTEDQRIKEINEGLDSIEGYVDCGDSEKDHEFYIKNKNGELVQCNIFLN